MTSKKHDPVLYVLVTGLTVFALAFVFVACGGGSTTSSGKVDDTPTTTATMTYEACQESAEYPGGRYAVEYDNGACKVQRPVTAPSTATTVPSFSSCAEAEANGYRDLRKGEPGYSTRLDRDGDGVACDT